MQGQQRAVVLHYALQGKLPVHGGISALSPDDGAFNLLPPGPQGFLPQPGRLLQRVHIHAILAHGRPVLGVLAPEQGLHPVNEAAQRVQQTPGYAAVLPCQGLKPGGVHHQGFGEVRRDLVHGLLRGQVDAALSIPGLVPLHQRGGGAVPLRQGVHGVVPVLPVFLRRDLLEPVGDLVLCHDLARVFGVRRDIDGAVPIPAVGPAIAGCGGDGDLHACGAAQVIVEAHGILRQVPGVVAGNEARLVSVDRGKLDAGPLPLETGRRVVLPGGVGRVPLGLVQCVGVLAAHLSDVQAGHACLVIGGEACVEAARVHAAIVGGGQGAAAALAQAAGCLLHTADVVCLLRSGPFRGLLRARLCFRGGGPGIVGNAARAPCKGADVAFHAADGGVGVDLLAGELGEERDGLLALGDAGRLVAADLLAPRQHFDCHAGGLRDFALGRILGVRFGVSSAFGGFRLDLLHEVQVPAVLRVCREQLPHVPVVRPKRPALHLLGHLVGGAGGVQRQRVLQQRLILAGAPNGCAGPVQVDVGGGDTAALHKPGGERTQEERICRLLRDQPDLVVLVEHEIAERRLQDLLKVFLRALSGHADADVGGHAEEGVVDVLNGGLRGLSGDTPAQGPNAAQNILKSRLARTDQEGVIAGLVLRVSLGKRLVIGVAARGSAESKRTGSGGNRRGSSSAAGHGGQEDGRGHVRRGGQRVVPHLGKAAAQELRADVLQPLPDLGGAELRCRCREAVTGKELPHAAAELVQSSPKAIERGHGRAPDRVLDALDVFCLLRAEAVVQRLLQEVEVFLCRLRALFCQEVVVDVYLVVGHVVVQGAADHLAVVGLTQGDILVVVPGVGDDIPDRFRAGPPAEDVCVPLRLFLRGVLNGRALGGILRKVVGVQVVGISPGPLDILRLLNVPPQRGDLAVQVLVCRVLFVQVGAVLVPLVLRAVEVHAGHDERGVAPLLVRRLQLLLKSRQLLPRSVDVKGGLPLVVIVGVLRVPLAPVVILAAQVSAHALQVAVSLVQGGEDTVHGVVSVQVPVRLKVVPVDVGAVLHRPNACKGVVPVLPESVRALIAPLAPGVVLAHALGKTAHIVEPGAQAALLVQGSPLAAAVGIRPVLPVNLGRALLRLLRQEAACPADRARALHAGRCGCGARGRGAGGGGAQGSGASVCGGTVFLFDLLCLLVRLPSEKAARHSFALP